MDGFQDHFSPETVKPMTDPVRSDPCSLVSHQPLQEVSDTMTFLCFLEFARALGMASGPSHKPYDPGCFSPHKPSASAQTLPLLPQIHLINSNSSLQLSAQSSLPENPSLPKTLLHDSLSWGAPLHPFFVTLNHLCISRLCGSFIDICPSPDCEF